MRIAVAIASLCIGCSSAHPNRVAPPPPTPADEVEARPHEQTALGPPTLDESRLFADLEYLASDALQGRLAGGTEATRFIVDAYRDAGLEPFGETFSSPFEAGANIVMGGSAHFVTIRSEDVAPQEIPSVSIAFGSIGAGLGRAVLVPPSSKPKRLTGKVAVTPLDTWDEAEATAQLRMLEAADAISAILVLPDAVIPAPSRLAVDIHAVAIRASDLKASTVRGVPFEVASRARATSPREFDDTRISVAQTLVRRQLSGTNILSTIAGSDLADELVVVGAHYDHIGTTDEGLSCRASNEDPSDDICNGADDNASGSAAVLALARALSQSNYSPRRTLVFAHFDTEEEGLHGSKRVAQTLGDKVVAMVNLDMIGRLEDGALEVQDTDTSEAWEPLVRQLAPDDLPLSFNTSTPGRSDHASFRAIGVPVVCLFTGEHEDYHHTSDEVSRIDRDGMRRITGLALRLTQALGDGFPVE